MVHGVPGPAPQTAKREQFARLIARGTSSAEACRIVGVNPRTGKRWRHGRTITSSSGVQLHYLPVINARKSEISARYLSEDERVRIADLRRAGLTVRAIAHAQFETIHPFIDGNGRTGRALIHTVLRRTDALRNTLIPISTVFAGDTDAYLAGLTAFREDPPRLDDWIIGFANAAELAAANAVRLSGDIAARDDAVREALIQYRQDQGISRAKPRSDAVILRILDALATEPVLTIETVAARHGVSNAAAHRALVELAEAGILGRNKDHKGKLICWTADRHLALVAPTERSNRVGAGDTEHHRPRLGPAAPDPSQTGLLRPSIKNQAALE